MKHTFETGKKKNESYAIVLPFHNKEKLSSPLFTQLDRADSDYVWALTKDMKGDFLEGQSALLPFSKKYIFLIALGDEKEWTMRRLRLAARTIFQKTKNLNTKSILIQLEDFALRGIELDQVAEQCAMNFEMASYDFNTYKEKKETTRIVSDSIIYKVALPHSSKKVERAVMQGSLIGMQVNNARELSNIPGGDMTPKRLASEAGKAGKEYGFDVKVLDEKEMKKLSMGAILGVSKGSAEEAQLIVMEYHGGSQKKKPIVFVGKGITFDSGGLNLKPSSSMDEMHMDMSGGAAVIGALSAIAQMKLKMNVVGIIPAVENMLSGQSYRPGDVLHSMSGKTIEVANTDAEGRVVLADALHYAERYKPSLVIDIATLTGACCVALGHHAMAVLSPEDSLVRKIIDAGEVSGDYVWQLPLWSEYESDIRGTVGDVLNASKTREAGTINGAMFLYQFAKNFPQWAHLDIASTMTTSPDQFLSRGASGTAVRLLVELARQY